MALLLLQTQSVAGIVILVTLFNRRAAALARLNDFVAPGSIKRDLLVNTINLNNKGVALIKVRPRLIVAKYSGAGLGYPMSEATNLLNAIAGEEAQTSQELLRLLYDELRKLAASRLANESGTQTLQPTALVHEAWLRLSGSDTARWKNRGHFFAAAAECMRRILIDRARRKQALRRGARATKIDLDHVDVAADSDPEILLLVNEALEELARENPAAADLVKLRFFVGLDYVQAAEALGISERSAKRYWTFARAWLFRELSRRAQS
jgi:RNA polymerase sigma factor (TIGR02999 family)